MYFALYMVAETLTFWAVSTWIGVGWALIALFVTMFFGMSIAGIITGCVGIIIAIIATIAFVLGQQTLQECQKVGTPDGNGNKVCQVGDNPDSRMTVPAQ